MLAQANPAAFDFTAEDYARALRAIPTADLVAEVECMQWEIAERECLHESFEISEIQLRYMTDELARRQRVASRSHRSPRWPDRDEERRRRVETVKARWPIVQFCEELLGARLVRAGRNFKACCPIPGHSEKTPSFTVYPDENRAWCYGCNRGGDVIKLTQFTFNFPRFLDALDRLEEEGGIG